VDFWELSEQRFYRPEALPFSQPTASKQDEIFQTLKYKTREQWIQRITFAAKNNAADTHTA